jgi:hypothetical protein
VPPTFFSAVSAIQEEVVLHCRLSCIQGPQKWKLSSWRREVVVARPGSTKVTKSLQVPTGARAVDRGSRALVASRPRRCRSPTRPTSGFARVRLAPPLPNSSPSRPFSGSSSSSATVLDHQTITRPSAAAALGAGNHASPASDANILFSLTLDQVARTGKRQYPCTPVLYATRQTVELMKVYSAILGVHIRRGYHLKVP